MTLPPVHSPLDHLSPYFTRFPLSFPCDILKRKVSPLLVLDPFCGCGTTLLATRMTGHACLGTDIHPVAVALSRAKLAQCNSDAVLQRAERILSEEKAVDPVEDELFWHHCFHESTYKQLLLFRQRYRRGNLDTAEELLYGILLGILHGSLEKGAFLSNHMPASFAPAPEALLQYWRTHKTRPPALSLMDSISGKVQPLKEHSCIRTEGVVYQAGYTDLCTLAGSAQADMVITSPPYFGLSNDQCGQWLRSWLLGQEMRGADSTDELNHQSLNAYQASLCQLWQIIARCCKGGASLWLQFGKVYGSNAPPTQELLLRTLEEARCGWSIREMRPLQSQMLPRTIEHFPSPSPLPEDEWIFHLQLEH